MRRAIAGAIFLVLTCAACSDGGSPGARTIAGSPTATLEPSNTSVGSAVAAAATSTPTAGPSLLLVSTTIDPAEAGEKRLVVGGSAEFVFGAKFLLNSGANAQEVIEVDAVGFERRPGFGVNVLALRYPLKFGHAVGEAISLPDPTRPSSTPLVSRPVPALDATRFVEQQDGDVDEEFKILFRKSLSAGREYYRTKLGIETDRAITILYSPMNGCGGPPPDRRGAAASAGPDRICVDPTRFVAPLGGLEKSGAHEHLHNLQHQLGCSAQADIAEKPDLWLMEGAADYFGWQAAMSFGLSPGDYPRFIGQGKARELRVGLRAFEVYDAALGVHYELFAAGVSFLVEEVSSPASWTAYCRARGQGVEWRAAFQSAFGLTTDEFYSKFEKWAAE